MRHFRKRDATNAFRAQSLTARRIDTLPAPDVRKEVSDLGARGLYLLAYPTGRKGFCVRYRHPQSGKNRKLVLPYGLTLAEARKAAATALADVEKGIDPAAAKLAAKGTAAIAAANTIAAVCADYMALEGKKLRTTVQRDSILRRQIYPAIGDRPVASVTRGEIVRLLDRIEATTGPRAADMVLNVIRKVFNWHAVRDETFRTPIVKGMARTSPADRARSRILSDDEIRTVWRAADGDTSPFGALVKFLLLTGARRNEAAALEWSEITGTDWLLPPERNKTKKPLLRPLSAAALALIEAQPRILGSRFVFTSTGRRPLVGLGWAKRKFDQQCDVRDWILHDLRRTARSLMSRAGVASDIAERCLGHLLGGVRKVYDRHEYHAEKQHAFEALAAMIGRIIDPPANNVRRLRG
jgi:integrase